MMAPGPPCSWSKIAPHDEDKDVFKKCTPAQCRLVSSGLFYRGTSEVQVQHAAANKGSKSCLGKGSDHGKAF